VRAHITIILILIIMIMIIVLEVVDRADVVLYVRTLSLPRAHRPIDSSVGVPLGGGRHWL
jgi:hypothetical protein